MHAAVVPLHQIAAGIGWLRQQIVDGDNYKNGSVLYPVTNNDYRDWRQKKGQGGDFIVYTNRVGVKLTHPIRINL